MKLIKERVKSCKRGVWNLYECRCGEQFIQIRARVKDGSIVSCGCVHRAKILSGNNNRSHGLSKTPTYATWAGIKDRCRRKNSKNWEDYGGRGVRVCERWDKFENFLQDMGERPPNKSIDRIDNNRGYYPDNCRWATPTEQANNKTTTRWVEFEGNKISMAESSKVYNINYDALKHRLNKGWPIAKALKEKTNKL